MNCQRSTTRQGLGLQGQWILLGAALVIGAAAVASVALSAAAWPVPWPAAWHRAAVAVATLAVLVIIQLGLGYSGRDGGNAAAWHVPLGVAIFGLSVGTTTTLSHLRSDTSAG